MSDIAIRVENCILSADLWSGAEGLSKLYHLGRAQQRHDTLRDALVAGLCHVSFDPAQDEAARRAGGSFQPSVVSRQSSSTAGHW